MRNGGAYGSRTLAGFLEPLALPCGNGAGAVFLPFGGIFSSRLSLSTEASANLHPLKYCVSKSEEALLPSTL